MSVLGDMCQYLMAHVLGLGSIVLDDNGLESILFNDNYKVDRDHTLTEASIENCY